MPTNPWGTLDDFEKQEERIRLHAGLTQSLHELERHNKPKTFKDNHVYHATVTKYQKDAVKHIKKVKKRLAKEGNPIEKQPNLYEHQRAVVPQLEDMVYQANDLVIKSVKRKAAQAGITNAELISYMRMKFDEHRRFVADIIMGGGKALTISMVIFFDANTNGIKKALKGIVSDEVAQCLDCFGRILFIVPGVTHKKEIMKEGLDPIFAKHGLGAAAMADNSVENCGLVKRAGLLPDEMEEISAGVYVLDGGSTFNHRAFATARIVISTVAKICSEINNSSFASTDFSLIVQDEGDVGSHPCPPDWFKVKYNAEQFAIFNGDEPPPLEDQSWFTVQEFFYRAFMVFFTGTPAEWCEGYERFDGVDVNPETMLKVTYGDQVVVFRAKSFNYVPMQPAGVRFSDSVDIVDVSAAPMSDRNAACKDPTPVLKIAMSHLYKRRKDEGVPYMSFLIAPPAKRGNADKPIVKQFAALVKNVLNTGVEGVFDPDPLCPAKKNMPSKFIVEAAYSGDNNSEKIMDRARKGQIDVLIIDGIGARGLDVALIGQIINFRDFDVDSQKSFNEAIQRFMRGMRVITDSYTDRAVLEGWEDGLNNLVYNTITSPTRTHQYCDIIEPFNLSSIAILRKFVKDNGCEFALRQAGTPMGAIDYQDIASDDDDDEDTGVSKDAFLKAVMAPRVPRPKPKKTTSPAGSAPDSASDVASGSDDSDDSDDDDSDSDDDTPVVSVAARRSQEQIDKAKEARVQREKTAQDQRMASQRAQREKAETARLAREERATRRNNGDRTNFVMADIKVTPVIYEGRELLKCELPFKTDGDYKYAMQVSNDKKASKKTDDAEITKWKFLENVKVVVADDMLCAYVPYEENIYGVRFCASMPDGEVHSGAEALSWKLLRKCFDKLIAGDAMDTSSEEEDEPERSSIKSRQVKPVIEDHDSDDCAETSDFESDEEDKVPYKKPEPKKKDAPPPPPPPPAAADDDDHDDGDDSDDDTPADAPVPPVGAFGGGGSTAVRSFGGSTTVRSFNQTFLSKPALPPARVPNATTDLVSDDDSEDGDLSVCNAPVATGTTSIDVDMGDDQSGEDDAQDDVEDEKDKEPEASPAKPPAAPPVVSNGKTPVVAPVAPPTAAPGSSKRKDPVFSATPGAPPPPAKKMKFKTSYTGTGHIKKIADIMAVASPGLRANAYSLSFPSSTTLSLKNEGIISSVAVGANLPLDESQVTKLTMKRPSKDFRVISMGTGDQKVEKKKINKADQVNAYLPGYLASLDKFESVILANALNSGHAKDSEAYTTAKKRAKDQCTRITMGMTSVISSILLDPDAVFSASLDDILALPEEQLTKHVSKFHVPMKSSSSFYTDITRAFREYNDLMMTRA